MFNVIASTLCGVKIGKKILEFFFSGRKCTCVCGCVGLCAREYVMSNKFAGRTPRTNLRSIILNSEFIHFHIAKMMVTVDFWLYIFLYYMNRLLIQPHTRSLSHTHTRLYFARMKSNFVYFLVLDTHTHCKY